MRQLNNNHLDTNLGATSQVVSSASQPLSVTTIIKDEIMKTPMERVKERQIRFHAKEMFEMLKKLNKHCPNTCRDLKVNALLLKIERGK